MLLVDSTFIARGFGGIAQDNRDFVAEFRNYQGINYLFDKNVRIAGIDGINLSIRMRQVNARALITNRTISMTEWVGSYFQAHLTGMAIPNGSNQIFLRLHDIFPITNPEWFTWQGQRIFNIATKSLSPKTVLVCNSIATQQTARNNPIFSKFESIIVPCRIMKLDESCSPCNKCEFCIQGFVASDFLLAVGTIEPRKNYGRLIEAWENSQKNSSFRHLVIIGRPGWKSRDIQRKIRRNKTIIWMSPCDFGLQRIFMAAGGFISASLAEGFDIPSVFAQTHGIPSAISSIDAHTELCSDAQILFNPKSVNEIAAAISRLNSSGLGANPVSSSLDWQKNFDYLTDLMGLQRK